MIGFKMIEVFAAFVEAFLGIWINTEVLGDGAEKKKIAVWASGLTCICQKMKQAPKWIRLYIRSIQEMTIF